MKPRDDKSKRAAHEPRLVGESWFATSEQHLTVREIAEKIVEVFQRGGVTHIEWPDERKRIEIDHVVFSSARLRSIVDWTPQINFEEGLRRIKSHLEQ
jgi:nucleoside-diphosphate-sugar epimerase